MTGNRRGRGDGSVKRRADGRWEGSVEVSIYGTGRRRKYVYGRTKAEVADRLRAVQHGIDEGLPVIDERVTVAKFLQTWLDQVVKPARGHATWQGYEVNVRRHIIPLIGNRTLAKLSPADIQALVNIKRDEGLAPRTVQYVHATIRAALGVAVRWGIIARNVATLVEPVSVRRAPVVPFSIEEVEAILQAATEDRFGAFYTVALAIGLRPSEALGLKWADIDFSEGTVRVQRVIERSGGTWTFKEPKSRTSRRTITLPQVCAEQLMAQRHRQLFERRSAETWQDNDLVFCTPTGEPLDRSELSRRFAKLQEKAGVKHHRLYDCRHTAASFLLAQGVAPRVVMEVLGHSSFALTMDTYTHVMPALMRDAANAMDRALGNTRRGGPAN
jgi:integrase